MENIQVERFEILKRQPLMKGVGDEELYLLLNLLDEVSYSPGAVIIEENELSDDLYFLIKGEVQLLKWDFVSQKWKAFETIQAEDMFGEMAFLDSSPRSSRIEAISPTTVLKLSKGKLDVTSIYNKIVKNIALINTHRLRLITQKYINRNVLY